MESKVTSQPLQKDKDQTQVKIVAGNNGCPIYPPVSCFGDDPKTVESLNKKYAGNRDYLMKIIRADVALKQELPFAAFLSQVDPNYEYFAPLIGDSCEVDFKDARVRSQCGLDVKNPFKENYIDEKEASKYRAYFLRYGGVSLWSYVTNSIDQGHLQNVSLGNILAWTENLLEALSRLHALGMCHGDLHTSNVLIDPKTNKLRIIDFGLSFTVKNNPGWHMSPIFRYDLNFSPTVHPPEFEILSGRSWKSILNHFGTRWSQIYSFEYSCYHSSTFAVWYEKWLNVNGPIQFRHQWLNDLTNRFYVMDLYMLGTMMHYILDVVNTRRAIPQQHQGYKSDFMKILAGMMEPRFTKRPTLEDVKKDVAILVEKMRQEEQKAQQTFGVDAIGKEGNQDKHKDNVNSHSNSSNKKGKDRVDGAPLFFPPQQVPPTLRRVRTQ